MVRVDKPHGKVTTNHINVNENFSGKKDPHTPISKTTANVLGKTGKVLDGVSKVAKPVALVTDAVRIGNAMSQDTGANRNLAMEAVRVTEARLRLAMISAWPSLRKPHGF